MPITQRITKRVLTEGASGGTASSLGGDAWHGAWSISWGNGWDYGTLATPATGEEPALDVTRRISGTASGGQTARVVQSELTSNHLLFEGDMQSGADALLLAGDEIGHLLLEGDEAEAGRATKRVIV